MSFKFKTSIKEWEAYKATIDDVAKEMHRRIDGYFTPGGFTAPPDHVHFNCRHEPVYSNNHFKSGSTYHKDGSVTEWRNYAIIKTEEREYKAPIIMEG